jgi:hypothetical protein
LVSTAAATSGKGSGLATTDTTDTTGTTGTTKSGPRPQGRVSLDFEALVRRGRVGLGSEISPVPVTCSRRKLALLALISSPLQSRVFWLRQLELKKRGKSKEISTSSCWDN